jgi:type II secretory pathway component PulF
MAGRADPLDPSGTEALDALGTQLAAGVPLLRAFEAAAGFCKRSPAGRRGFLEAKNAAERGEPFEKILERLSGVLSYPDRAVLAAGWHGGRIDWAMRTVVEHRRTLWKARRRIRGQLILPAGALLIACFVFPLPGLVRGGSIAGYLAQALTPLAIAIGAFVLIRRMQRARAREWARRPADAPPPPPTGFDRLLLAVPVVRGVERWRNLSAFGSVVSTLLEAGVGILDALHTALPAMPNGVYRKEVDRCRAKVREGRPLSEGLQSGSLWPPEWVQGIEVGEESGNLDDVLSRLAGQARERYVEAVEAAGAWVPRILYALVAIFIIYQIFRIVRQIAELYSGLAGGL